MRTVKKFLLKLYIRLYNYLYNKISKLATQLNQGIHPKHRIMKYYQFFLDNIDENSKVLDIGCGIGYLTDKISKKAGYVVGLDLNEQSLDFAKENFDETNIKYIHADVIDYNFHETFDYIVLSNVLEHINERTYFLKKIKPLAKYLLIRVPMINRSWLPLYKKEMNMDYRLDNSHYIEYTLETLKKEMELAELEILSYEIKFGEIWAKIKT